MSTMRYALSGVTFSMMICLWTSQLFGTDQLRRTFEHGNATINMTVSTETVQVAEPFQLMLEVVVPPGSIVRFPNYESQLASFEVIDSEELLDLPTASGRLSRVAWTLESLQAGDLEIPPIAISIVDAQSSAPAASSDDIDKHQYLFQTEPVGLRVRSAIEAQADPTQIKDIHSVIDVPIPTQSTNWSTWILPAMFGAAIALSIPIFILRKRSRPSATAWAKSKLKALRIELATSNGNPQNSSLHASDVLASIDGTVREYLALQFRNVDTAQTTEEMLGAVENLNAQTSGSKQVAIAQLTKLFTAADAAKYAGLKIDQRDVSSLWKDADQAIELLGQLATEAPDPSREGQK